MKKVYPREEVCIACHLCEIYCLVEHSRTRDLVKAYTKESPRALSRIRVEAKGPVSLALQCRHCVEPFCVDICFTGALYQNSTTGVVELDLGKCVGCWGCILACPYGVIRRDEARGVIAKCDLCPRLQIPACVSRCPNEALIYAEGASLWPDT